MALICLLNIGIEIYEHHEYSHTLLVLPLIFLHKIDTIQTNQSKFPILELRNLSNFMNSIKGHQYILSDHWRAKDHYDYYW